MNETGLKAMIYGIWSAVAISALGLVTVLYWTIVSPVPDIIVHSSRVEEVLPANGDGVLQRPGIFRITRDVDSSSAKTFRIHAYFETPQSAEGQIVLPDGTRANPTKIQVKIGEDNGTMEKGRHIRSRVWETPTTLPEGEWSYVGVAEFCHPLKIRCEFYSFPPVPVRLGETMRSERFR